jgi:hypothetical protein
MDETRVVEKVKTKTKPPATLSAKTKTVTTNGDKSKNGSKVPKEKAACPWMELEPPPVRTLKVYGLDPSAGNYIGNVMSVKIKWEDDLKPGPVGRKIAVVDYDGANKRYYPPVDLDDARILARGGLSPSESDPRFHQQMVYAVAMETVERFEAALGRSIRWRRADRPRGFDQQKQTTDGEGGSWRKTKDIWKLTLFPHAIVQANAFYSPEAKGILFGYFTADETNQGQNLPGQRVFTCLSHDIIAHEVTHAIIDGIRTYFTEPTNPDVLAFHEAFSDLAALFSHFSHKEALLDTIQKTGGQLYQFELKPNAAPPPRSTNGSEAGNADVSLSAQLPTRNPLTDLAKQFGEAAGMRRGLRGALDRKPNANDINTRVSDVHFRGSILVAAVFDAYFSIYLKRTADLFRVYRAGGGAAQDQPDDLPGPLARLLAEQASATAAEFFQLCARALDYCPPVDITFGDYLRALITAHIDLKADDGLEVRDALMQAFSVRGIYPESAAFFSQDSLCWPKVPAWTDPPAEGALPPVEVFLEDPDTKEKKLTTLVFGDPNGLSKEEKDINGKVLRQYAEENAERLGFNADPSLPLEFKPYAPSFHPVFRIAQDGSLRTDMVVELVQTQRVAFDDDMPQAGSFPFRAGVTLIISAPTINDFGYRGKAYVRFAIGKRMVGPEADARKENQRVHNLSMGLAEGNTEDPNHFQVNFGLLHQGL